MQPVLMDVYSGVNSIVLDADTLREVGIDLWHCSWSYAFLQTKFDLSSMEKFLLALFRREFHCIAELENSFTPEESHCKSKVSSLKIKRFPCNLRKTTPCS